jgi:hypothetical protein
VKSSAQQAAAQNRIHDLLTELADIVGPNFDGAAAEELDVDEQPEGSVFLGEWVMVMSWMDEAGESFMTRIGSANLLSHHRVGLLHEGLHGFGDR